MKYELNKMLFLQTRFEKILFGITLRLWLHSFALIRVYAWRSIFCEISLLKFLQYAERYFTLEYHFFRKIRLLIFQNSKDVLLYVNYFNILLTHYPYEFHVFA